jgi:hypothetical protein
MRIKDIYSKLADEVAALRSQPTGSMPGEGLYAVLA